MRVICATQDSSEWFEARIGKVTASCIHSAMKMVEKGSKKRGDKRWESSSKRKEYISELAWGMITHIPVEHFVSRAMDLGKAYERMARAEYSFRFAQDEEVKRTGFVLHPTLNYLGASPDGLLENGGVELKVPQMPRHKMLMETGEIPEEWVMQCYCNMLCCEKEWWDFASFMPADEQFGQEALAMPNEFRMFRKRFFRNDAIFEQMEEGATSAMEEAAEKVKQLRAMYPEKGAPKSKFRAEIESAVLASEMSESEAYESAMEAIDAKEMVP
jgi:hypothetical protein